MEFDPETWHLILKRRNSEDKMVYVLSKLAELEVRIQILEKDIETNKKGSE